MALDLGRVRRHRAPRQRLGAGVERVPTRVALGAGNRLALVHEGDGGAPVGLVVGGVECQRGLEVGQRRSRDRGPAIAATPMAHMVMDVLGRGGRRGGRQSLLRRQRGPAWARVNPGPRLPNGDSAAHRAQAGRPRARARAVGALIAEYTANRVPDYQMSALLMAIVWRGLTPAELAALTDAMLAVGRPSPVRRVSRCPGWTSTPPAAWATRSRCCWRRWSRAAAWRCR